jgi:hypothetical protein
MCANPLTGFKIKRLRRLQSLFDRDYAVPTGTFFQWPAIFSDFSYALSQSQHDLIRNAKLHLRFRSPGLHEPSRPHTANALSTHRMNRVIAILASAMLLILLVTLDDSPVGPRP